MSFWAPLHVFRSEPDPQLFATHLLVQPPSELLVLAAIADEARLVLNRLHRPDERRQVGDEILRHPAAGGRASQKLDAAGIRNSEWTLIAQMTQVFELDAPRRFLMVRTQLEAELVISKSAAARRA